MDTSVITIETKLTEKQYRRYMNFHVLGNRRDVTAHVIISVLIVLFGFVNFRAGSPVLGWIFVTLGIYVFASRFFRFYTSVNRIIHEFSLSADPKFFYMLQFRKKGNAAQTRLLVRNATEEAVYDVNAERIFHVYFREKEQIAYLYLTKSNAFLLPYDSFTEGSPADLRQLLEKECGSDKISML